MMITVFDPSEIEFGFDIVDPEVSEFWWDDDPFDDAEMFLSGADTPDPSDWESNEWKRGGERGAFPWMA